MPLLKTIEKHADLLLSKSSGISDKRKALLEEPAKYIAEKMLAASEINLIFICTHNSRRSIMAQIWAIAAAEYFSLNKVRSFSGGTEATAFFPIAVDAVGKAGFLIEKKDDSSNPLYLVRYAEDKEPIKCFSKIYNNSFNPSVNFAVLFTCSDAERNCPTVFGAEERFSLPYEDPKIYDRANTAADKYFERFEQIGREMLYLFQRVSEIYLSLK